MKTDEQEEEQVLARCREIFTSFDKDGDGSITELELGVLLRSLGIKPDSSQIEDLFSRGDRDSNGLIDFGEFLQLIGAADPNPLQPSSYPSQEGDQQEDEDEPIAAYKHEELVSLFKAFDKDGNGFITAAELAHSMAKMGRRLSARELTNMMAEADADGDGRISFDEFVSALSGRSSHEL